MPITENGKKWLAALRSGEYKQGRGVLDDGQGRYCCLGVACKLAAEELGTVKVEEEAVTNQAFEPHPITSTAYDGQQFTLPHSVMDWLGVRTDDPYVREMWADGETSHSCSLLNDNEMPFTDIADMIEGSADYIFKGRDDD